MKTVYDLTSGKYLNRKFKGENKMIITKKIIEDGLMAKVIIPKLEDDGLKAYIGDYWFYFGGSEFEYTNPEDITFTTLTEEIFIALNGFVDDEGCDDEYLYYYYYLMEHI